VNTAARGGWAYLELDDVPMPTTEVDAVQAIVDVVEELLNADIAVEDEYGNRALLPSDMAVGVTHGDQRDHIRTALQDARPRTGLPVGEVVGDTANVLQGREFQIVLVWHPLSGRRDASRFHLGAGGLCVLLSRHRQACIVISRGGRDQLAGHAHRIDLARRVGPGPGRLACPPRGPRPPDRPRGLRRSPSLCTSTREP